MFVILRPQCNIQRYRYFSHFISKTSYSVPKVNRSIGGCMQLSTDSIFTSLVQTSNQIFVSLSTSYPVHLTQEYLIYVHDKTGLPWWSTIILSTFILRSLVTLPLAAYQNNILAKLENLGQQMPKIAEELKGETAYAIQKFNWSKEHATRMYRRSLKKQWQKLIIDNNCHPFKATILIWIQFPMWICLSSSIRNLVYMLPDQDIPAQIIYAQLQLGGVGWIPNLTIPDASYMLPILLTAINLLIIEIQTLSKIQKKTKVQTYLTNFFRLLSIGLLPIASTVPSALCLYWVSSSAFGLIQNLILLSPTTKRIFRIQITNKDREAPYKGLYDEFRKKYIN